MRHRPRTRIEQLRRKLAALREKTRERGATKAEAASAAKVAAEYERKLADLGEGELGEIGADADVVARYPIWRRGEHTGDIIVVAKRADANRCGRCAGSGAIVWIEGTPGWSTSVTHVVCPDCRGMGGAGLPKKRRHRR